MKKILLLLLFAFIYKAAAFAQQNNEADQILKKSEFIFEGMVLKEDSVRDIKTGKLYKMHFTEVKKIFRGKNMMPGKTILLLTEVTYEQGGGDVIIHYPENWNPYPIVGKKAMFFTNSAQINTNSSLIKGETMIVTPIKIVFFQIINYYKGRADYAENKIGRGFEVFGYIFKNKEEYYNFLKQYSDITIPPLADEGFEKIPEDPDFHPGFPKGQIEQNNKEEKKSKKKENSSGSIEKLNQIDYAQHQKNYNDYMKYLQTKLQKQKNNPQNKSAGNSCKEFFISEYIDGPNKNKVIEIFNPSDSVKSLVGYSLKIFNNGAPTPLEVQLSGNVNPKETYVVAHPQADAQILSKANQTDVKMNFDGNDAVVLNKGTSTYIDKIGEIGVNPGVGGWTVPPSSSTKSHDLRRKIPIDEGEIDWNNGKNQWNSFPPDSSQNVKQHQNVCSASNDLSFSFANATESGTSPKYFEFDIMASANNNSTYFANCLLRIAYNSSAFGSSLVQNNKVTITKGSTYNTVTYIDPDANAIDETTSVLGVPFGDDWGQTSWNRTLVTTTPTQILHFKIEIQNCGQFSGIDFTDITFTPMFSSYTSNPTEDALTGTVSGYDNTTYDFGLDQELCPFKVTSFNSPVYPGSYYAGTTSNDYLLIINGNGFGATRGNGNVFFNNAHNGGQTQFKLDDTDFISWTDNQIQIRMPSEIKDTNVRKIPGSGMFNVQKDDGTFTPSNNPIDMPYAIINALDPSVPEGKIRIDLVNVNSSDPAAIIFRLDQSIINYSDPKAAAIVKRAVRDWYCEALVYFEVGNDTTINTIAKDGVSAIFFTPIVNNNPSALGGTKHWLKDCNDNSSKKHSFPVEIDIAIKENPSSPWFFDTTGAALPAGMTDFYEVILHELGHAALLQHITSPNASDDPQKLLFWAALAGPQTGLNRRYIKTNDQYGALNVVLKGETIIFNSCPENVSTLNLPPNQSCGTLGLPSHLFKSADFIIYPNPTENNFTVEFEIGINSNIQFTIYDYTGKQVQQIQKQQFQKGKYQEQINIERLTNGFYFFTANINGRIQTFKIIKM